VTQSNLDIVYILIAGVGQKFGDTGKSRKFVVSLLGAADSVASLAQMKVDEITTERIWTLRRKSMRKWV
jgi:hypothetical protein